MKNSMKVLVVILLTALLATSCTLFGQGTPAPASGTPNATLTALFDLTQKTPVNPTSPVIATATSQVILPTVQPPTTAPTTVVLPTTVAPTATAAAATRTGLLIKAGYLSTPPNMDGSWSDWRDKTTLYPISYVVWGAKNWSGDADLQASFGAGWDTKNLYVGFKVIDDKYVQNSTGSSMYKGDSMELLFDTNLNGDYYVQSLSSDDYQLGISCGNPDKGVKPEAYLWFPANVAGARTQVKVACIFETGRYRAEVSIPWSVLGVTPSKDLTMGFAASVNDNDDPTQNVQQTMLSTAPDRVLTDPTTWGWMTLLK